MSNIKFYSKAKETAISVIPCFAEQTLQFYITKVLNRLNETDDGITWYICTELDLQNILHPNRSEYIKRLEIITGLVRERLYGLSDPQKNEIFISTDAINSAPIIGLNNCLHTPIGNIRGLTNNKENLLVRVIIDELTHIVTKRIEHDAFYQKKYDEYIERYFCINHAQHRTQHVINKALASNSFRRLRAW